MSQLGSLASGFLSDSSLPPLELRLGRRNSTGPPQQLFGWRRQLREAAGGHSEADEVQFVPAVVDAVVPVPTAHRERKAVRKPDSGIIEIED
ncbi:hypothetical protein IVB38_11845 [Bradyrhizobium sp. 38]|uniref:hypothetical protein n=1 Tax=unclassified Bradyrhizobium TaxID=2631580 RepID=UPI001FF886E6|nr:MULTISPECIES: hypothetical protein [unclassified Bradyrhizobium]MCK1336700.1 hypothetical protein [Bradyrhizobium sp. 38]MCK1782412.1 hypothetical protein [Bradyrhizobium sp. 132]